MKRSTIAPAFLLAGALLIGSLSACTQSNASDTAQPDATAANPTSSSQTKTASASSDASKPDATAANLASSTTETKADTASSDAAKPDEVAANPTTSQKPKLSDAERAQKRKEVSQQLAKVLTPEQYKQLDTKLKAGEKMRKALNAINLTADQKTKVKAILKAAYPRTQNGHKPSETKAQ
jgi:Spy/CpxP family protein refolding chaperone